MELVDATIQDIDILTEMNIRLREDEEIDNVMSEIDVYDRMRDFLQSDEYHVLLLINKTIVMGYALIKTSSSPMYLRQLFIKRDYRQKGFGTFIINSILKFFNINQIDLEVMAWNDSAIEFYEKFGFKKRYIGMRYKIDL